MIKISKLLKEYRERYGYTQIDLARIVGVTRRTINQWERGKTIPNDVYTFKLKMEGVI